MTMTAHEIRDARKARGWTQVQLAAAINVSQAAVGHWESGYATPRKAAMARLEAKLRVEPALVAPPPSAPTPAPREGPMRIVLVHEINATKPQRAHAERAAQALADALEAAEETILGILNARAMDDAAWHRNRAAILRPWGKACMALERVGLPPARPRRPEPKPERATAEPKPAEIERASRARAPMDGALDELVLRIGRGAGTESTKAAAAAKGTA